jgi:hypothetical protein
VRSLVSAICIFPVSSLPNIQFLSLRLCVKVSLIEYVIEGDGEISFCGAIEMAGVITLNFRVMKNGVADLGIKSPLYLPGPVEPHYGPGRYLTFEGFSVDEHGKQHYMDVTVAYRQTTLRKCIPCRNLLLHTPLFRR